MLPLIEDAAQAQGASRNGRNSGQWGRAGGTSFYPGKNLGAYGDAGAVLTNDAEIAARVRAMRNHGGEAKYEHTYIGTNSRLDTMQAVVLRAKLRRLEGWNEQRRVAADRYAELLGDVAGVTLPTTLDGNVHVWHLYVIEVDDRDEVLARLNADGIGAGIHYPMPVHLTEAFAASLGHGRGDFPVAERLASSHPVAADLPRHHRGATGAGGRELGRRGARMSSSDVFVHPLGVCESDTVGDGTRVWAFAHVLPGASVGAGCNICDHAFIEGGAVVGDRVTVKNAVLIWDGVTVEDDVFIGPNAIFTNDFVPRAHVRKSAGGVRAHRRSQRGIDRRQRNHRVRGDDRRQRPRRRRRRGHPRRSRPRPRRRQPRPPGRLGVPLRRTARRPTRLSLLRYTTSESR